MMNRIIITMIAIIVVIVAMCSAVIIFKPEDRGEVEEKIETRIAEEEILDDCTDEYEGMEYENTIKTNTEEEKTSPNCSLTIKTYYEKCGHTKNEYSNLPQDFVNLTKEEIQEKYIEYELEEFSTNSIILKKRDRGECGEHYIVKDKEGMVTIYQILEDGSQKEIETTGVSIEYLPEEDKINMKNGIQINGKKELNRLIEDFE